MSVFLPTTPNPTSGFLLFVPRKDVIILDMSVEEAAKMVISAGLVSPDYPKILPVQTGPKSKTEPACGVTGSAGPQEPDRLVSPHEIKQHSERLAARAEASEGSVSRTLRASSERFPTDLRGPPDWPA
jgi:hypothetical protein